MQCLKPISLPDGRVVPCGKCGFCLANKACEWYIRLNEEFKVSHDCVFFTLTYDDEHLPIRTMYQKVRDKSSPLRNRLIPLNFKRPIVNSQDISKFVQSIRDIVRYDGIRFKYFIISEYGPRTLRPHYHGILFNLPSADICIDSAWKSGFTEVSEVIPERIRYLANYTNSFTYLPLYLRDTACTFMRCSKCLGKSFLTSDIISYYKETLNTFYQDGDRKLRLPKYYRDKLFDDSERELIRDRNEAYLRSVSERARRLVESDGMVSNRYYCLPLQYLVEQEAKLREKFDKSRKL